MSITLILIFILSRAWGQGMISVDEVKAAFIFHFIDFTQWQDKEPVCYVCVPQDERLRRVSRQSLEGKVIDGRKILVVDRWDHCHVLVADQIPSMTDSVLTIGPINNGSLLEFKLIDHRLRFAVNIGKLKKTKLKISSQLLKLAILENG
ncbi:MAG: YfiR family protein [Candidatus Omnitrophica bacterium]|nr:YfiR family protein [Candidatus Omnitrophota bacterium]